VEIEGHIEVNRSECSVGALLIIHNNDGNEVLTTKFNRRGGIKAQTYCNSY